MNSIYILSIIFAIDSFIQTFNDLNMCLFDGYFSGLNGTPMTTTVV